MAVSASLHATKSMARGTAARQGTGIFTILPRFNQSVIFSFKSRTASINLVKSAVGWVSIEIYLLSFEQTMEKLRTRGMRF